MNELGAVAPCDLDGKWNNISLMCTLMVRKRIITELVRHLDQSLKRLKSLSENRSWSLLAAASLQSSSDYLFYQCSVHVYRAF